MPTLMVYLPGLPPVSHLVKDETTTIGRMKGNTIVIEDSSISLMHAKITRKNGLFYLKDLNSTNGTIINGQPISEVSLKDSDRVRFAEVSAQFLAEPAVESLAPAPAIATTTSGVAQVPIGPAVQAPPQPVVVATAMTISAPLPITKPAATMPSVKPRRMFALISAGLGVTAALAVIGLIGWRLFHLDTEKAINNPGDAVPARLAAQEKKSPAGLAQIDGRESPGEGNAATVAHSPPPVLSRDPLELAILLKSKDPVQRRQVARALHGLGAEASQAAESLREALQDPDEEVQMWAALALVNSQQYEKRAVPILVHVLQNENSVLRQVACLSLGLVPYEDPEREIVIPALAETAGKDVDEDVRKAARSALNIIAPDLYKTDSKTASTP